MTRTLTKEEALFGLEVCLLEKAIEQANHQALNLIKEHFMSEGYTETEWSQIFHHAERSLLARQKDPIKYSLDRTIEGLIEALKQLLDDKEKQYYKWFLEGSEPKS